nr:GNAT family N-acetyltransferase [Prevotella sp.]
MITYKSDISLNAKQLEDLFLSVEWSSGHYPEKLEIAMHNCPTVITAWDGDEIVGLINVMDDGIMNAYIHYLLIRPEYQGKGIGQKLLSMVKDKYKDYLRIILVSYTEGIPFYEHCGFKKGKDCAAMYLTSLWT